MSFNFGAKSTTATPAFGSSTSSTAFSFGGGDANKPLFGASAVGSPTTTQTSSLFGGTKPTSSFDAFKSPPNQTVGSPGFGQAAQSQPASAFGTPTVTPAFGSAATQASTGLFGTPQASTFAFGKTGTTTSGASPFAFTPSSTAFAAPTTATITAAQPAFAFGAATTSASTLSFGQGTPATSSTFSPAKPISTLFGQPNPPSFGAATGATPAFGAQATSTPTSAFSAPTAAPSFGAQPTPTPSVLSFGAQTTSTSSFGLQTTSAPSYVVQATSTPSFGAPTTAPPAFGSQTSTAPTFGTQKTVTPSFGAPATCSATAPAYGATSAPSLGISTPSFSLAPSIAATTSAPAQSSTGFTFGTGTSAATSTPGSSLATATTTASLSFSAPSTQTSGFGQTPASTASIKFGTSTAATTSVLSFGLTTTTATTSSTPLSTATTTVTTTMPALTIPTTTVTGPPQPISNINFAQLEESINKWTLELEEQERNFINQATQINAWDRLLIANGEKIVELNEAVQNVKNEQQSLEHELDFVVAQQTELDELLKPLEKQLSECAPDKIRDPEREHMYQLIENLDSQLLQMSGDLKEVIEHLNETNRSQDTSDPIVQIGRILNAHMSSMQWVDNSIAQISTKLDQLKVTHDTLRKDNERSFQLTYN